MAFEYQEIYDEYLELDEEEKIARAKQAVANIKEELSHFQTKEYCDYFPYHVVAAFIGSDLMVNTYELDMFNAIFDENYDLKHLASFVKNNNDKGKLASLLVDIDNYIYETKNELLILGLTMIISDEKVNPEENEFLEKILIGWRRR